MDKLKGILTKKYGGLNGYVWLIVGVAGVGIGLYFYHRSKTSTATSTTASTASTPSNATQTDAGIGAPGYGDYAPVGANAGDTSGGGSTTINVAPSNPTNWQTMLQLTNASTIPMYGSSGALGDTSGTSLGQTVATIPANTVIQATGPEVSGSTENGSELWYPVTYQGVAGFINASYVGNAATSILNAPVVQQPVTVSGTPSTIRAKQTQQGQQFVTYDKNNPGGVPFYTSLSSKATSQAAFGAPITITGSPVSGSLPNSGSNTYTPITYNGKAGYVSTQDIG